MGHHDHPTEVKLFYIGSALNNNGKGHSYASVEDAIKGNPPPLSFILNVYYKTKPMQTYVCLRGTLLQNPNTSPMIRT